MEGKTVILTVLLLSLVMAQIQVEAAASCPSTKAQNCFRICRLKWTRNTCARLCGCTLVNGESPEGYEQDILQNTGANKEEYCKLGCASSVCSAITTLQNSGEEVVNGAVEKCTNACSAFCTKGSVTAVQTA